MIINFENKPLQVFEPFHRSSAGERVLFGAYGSGKSFALMDEVIAWCLEQPGIEGMVTRKTAPALRDTTEKVFQQRMPPGLWDAGTLRRAGGHFESFEFPNGSVVYFRSMDDPIKHRSFNLGFIAWDELNQFSKADWLAMESRVRQRELSPQARARGYTGQITRRGMFGATNPGGKDWVYYYFHPESKDRAPNTAAFFSTTLDNPFLPADYVERLLQYPEHFIRRFVLCKFDDFAGRIYDEWSYDTHTVDHPKFPDGVRPLVWMGMDPGTENPTAGLWVWADRESRRLVGIAEYEQAALAVDIHSREWRRIEAKQRMNVRWRVADPNSLTQRDRGTMISLQTQYAKQGFHFDLGASSHNARIPALGHLIHTRRFVVSRQACPKTFEAIQQYQWTDLTPLQEARGEQPREQPLKKNDHLVNCAEYIAGREAPMPDLKRRPRYDNFSDEARAIIRKQIRRKAAAKRNGGRSPLGTV